MDEFELVSRAEGLPVFAFTTSEEVPFDVHEVSEAMRARGWLLPAYQLPPALDHMSVLRIVVRNGLSRDLAAILVDDLHHVAERLSHPQSLRRPGEERQGFHH
jgi:glutamate decarboxylase